ncbi:MAG: hypothetical protein JO104_02430 [Candidatus Eremiobacteraeota bacterium]|nr:hypothetical protein [Candidatus Eremiobacteraeota bacterium]
MELRTLIAALLLLAQTNVTSAPADRYFGSLKMSALRIRYETMQLKKRYETHELLPEQAEHLLLLTENALHQWAKQYPKDPWLPSTAYAMAGLYAELPGELARDRAVALFGYVKSSFPTSSYARESRDQLHRGVTVKSEPAWAMVTASPSPLPTTSTSPLPTSAPSSLPSSTASPAVRLPP